jgi:hypothetical protein
MNSTLKENLGIESIWAERQVGSMRTMAEEGHVQDGLGYGYCAVIQGNDWSEDDGWAEEHAFVQDVPLADERLAIQFLRGITPEQALRWERESGCNALDIIVVRDEVSHGMPTYGFEVVATCEWIGSKLNGIWLGDKGKRIEPISHTGAWRR